MVLGLLAGAFHWSTLPIVGGVAIVIPIIGFRDYWCEAKFWITILLLSAIQIPVVIWVRPMADRLKLPFVLPFCIIDCAVVISTVYWLCMDPSGKEK